jgi:2-polyprenyl-3-methyl-5-hydroxy-6-metoxy-1,4-benzoquinol methylase
MEADRIKWNERYADDEYQMGLAPSGFLAERMELLKSLSPGNKALDIACGEGRNSIFLASGGFLVTAVDISDRGIEKGRRRMVSEGVSIDFRVVDLDVYEITERYDLIVNINFLQRDLIPKYVAALNQGGVLLFETILDGPKLPGVHTKNYLLQPGELYRLFSNEAGMILEYAEFLDAETPTARLLFQKERSSR